jgi:hypothetical protein
MSHELPSQVLTELRKKTGRGRREFGELTGWSYHTQFRLEENKTPFKMSHLDSLVVADWFEEADEWYQRFEAAIAQQFERESELNRAGSHTSFHEERTGPSDFFEELFSALSGRESGYFPGPPHERFPMSRRPANVFPRAIALNDKRTLNRFADRKEGILHAGALARAAGYAVSNLHLYAVFKLAAQQAGAERMRAIICSSSDTTRAGERSLDQTRRTMEAYINQILRDSSARICHLVETATLEQRVSVLDALFGG